MSVFYVEEEGVISCDGEGMVLPENIRLELDPDGRGREEAVEIFRFRPDGTASPGHVGVRDFSDEESLTILLSVSPLTGSVDVRIPEEQEK